MIAYPKIVDVVVSEVFQFNLSDSIIVTRHSQNRRWGVIVELRIVALEVSKDNQWETSFRPEERGGGRRNTCVLEREQRGECETHHETEIRLKFTRQIFYQLIPQVNWPFAVMDTPPQGKHLHYLSQSNYTCMLLLPPLPLLPHTTAHFEISRLVWCVRGPKDGNLPGVKVTLIGYGHYKAFHRFSLEGLKLHGQGPQ